MPSKELPPKARKARIPAKQIPRKKAIEGSATVEVSLRSVLRLLIAAYKEDADDTAKSQFAEALSQHLKQSIRNYTSYSTYNILVLFDNSIIVKNDADRIYQALEAFEEKKPLLLVLLSRGGELGPAYLIGKLCRESAKQKFSVVVPRYAKSAATLIATAADEIHMGSLSELGPIDPQINERPALGLKNSIEHIASLVHQMPDSAEMFAKYLSYSVEPIQIGHYERAAESAEQYAIRLLEGHKKNFGWYSEVYSV